MGFQSPYRNRRVISEWVFRIVLILLVNGWVDYANFSLRDHSPRLSQEMIFMDDYDTFYEWISEEIFGVEDAIPEQKGESDDTGKISPLKITLACADDLPGLPSLNMGHANYEMYLFLQWTGPAMNIWDPPPQWVSFYQL